MLYSNRFYKKELLQKGFYQNRDENGKDYNYDITPLIHEFDFYDFIDYAERFKEEIKDYGAFIVITNRQYIIGYNASFGEGTHLSSFARVMKDISGGGIIINSEEANHLTNECTKNFLTGRVMYERCESFGRPKCSGHISFNLVGKTITQEQLQVFEKFKEDYGLEIQRIIRKYGQEKFKIIITYKNEEGILDSLITDNLDDLYNLLLNCIEDKQLDIEERIIGIDCNVNRLSKRL